MRQALTKWLAAPLVLCLLLTLSPAALMEGSSPDFGDTDAVAVADKLYADFTEETRAPVDEPEDEITSEAVDEPVADVEMALEEISPIPEQGEGDEWTEDAEMFLGMAAAPTFLAPAGEGVAINAATFPDPAFRGYVSEKYDTDGNGTLSKEEADAVTGISLLSDDSSGPSPVAEIQAANLKGIEYFPNLAYLYCTGVGLTSLDVSANSQLLVLEVVNNKLTSLNVSNNGKLETLYASMNRLTSLNVGKSANLETLLCDQNQLTSLDLSGCAKLTELTCYGNNLTQLDISKCPVIAAHVKGTGDRFPIGKYSVWSFEGSDDGHYYQWLCCDSGVQVVGGSAETYPMVKVAKKSVKATVNIGSRFMIDLNGAQAKSFTSSKKKVATVDKNGVVTPKASGKAKITIRIGRKKRVLTLTVKDPTIPTKVTLNMSGTVAVKKGTSVTLTAALPAGTNSPITWKSSNKKIATVKNGVVTFKKKGKVTITATATRGKKKASVKFKVSQ